jgi:Rne/Rng family ribonuclease
MSKELFVSSTPHQTKVALVENDQLSEVYFERENEYTLAGSIYKGRVTRVLPGMQSAFVDIGLERDAFLYVSDFFEMEDDDETFEPIPANSVAKPFEVKPSEPAPEAAAQFRSETPVLEGGFAEGESEETNAPSESSEGGGRRWRGRRRRRGGRDRGFPESKFAEPSTSPAEETKSSEDEETPDETFDKPVYKPIILPGESIAKFNRKSETEANGDSAEERSEASASPAEERNSERYSRDDRRPRRFERGRDRDRNRGRDRDTVNEPERPYAPIVLPGESISKYRNVQPQPTRESPVDLGSGPATAQEEAPQEAHESVVVPQEDFRPASTDAPEPWSPTQEQTFEEAPKEAAVVAPLVEEEEIEATHENVFDQVRPSEEEKPREDESRFERMDFASTYGTETNSRAEESEEEHEETHEYSSRSAEPLAQETVEEGQAQESAVTPAYHNAPAGAFEEEEFDADEEDDLPHPSEVLYDADDYEELEEETLEPMEHAAKELVQAMQETGAIQEISGGYEGDDSEEEENGDIEEIENAAYAEIGEPETGRAELRGPSGTAGFQQRAPRPDFDRARRGRRGGGRRMGRGGPRREQSRPQVLISELLKEGQEILVQIAKEPIGKKGARITSHIALPGRFLVYMPSVNHVGVSRKISSDEERLRLKRIVASERENGHGGFIVRTAAAGISEEDLRNDIRFLKSLWHDIRTRADNSKPPALIYHDLNLVERTMRDLVTEDFTAIWADTEQEYERINRFVSRFQPGLVRRVKLYTKDTPLFEQFGLDAEINKSLKSKVWLKSGGYIVINQTEALVAIDINTGKYVGKTQRLEDTIFKTNVDAIKEIVRQIRLRDLGGIIVIDFIDMDERKNRQKVMQALEEEMKHDRAPSKVLQFNDFGLVAITRKRVKQSLERTLGTPCPYCTGNGYVKSPSTICNEIYVEMRKMVKQFEGDILLRVNPEVAKALKANNGRWLIEMEELTSQNILVKPDPTLHQEQFDM